MNIPSPNLPSPEIETVETAAMGRAGSNAVRDFKQLLVWQAGMRLAKAVYVLTRNFPAEEKFELTSQMRRAGISIPSNIAEGQARNTRGEFVQFLSYAEGSLAELETQILISIDLKFCSACEASLILKQIDEEQRMVNGLRKKLR